MATVVPDSGSPSWRSTGLGVAVGTGILLVYLLAGLFFESWSVSDFLSNLSPESAGWLLLSSGLAIATFAVPVALYDRFRIVAPLVVLGAVIVGWVAIGVSSGTIEAGATFGLSVYAVGVSPVYVVLYLLLGGSEYYIRKRRRVETR